MAAKPAISSKKALLSSSQLGQLIVESFKSIGNMPIVGALVAEFIGAFMLTAIFVTVSGQPLYVAFALIGIVAIIGTVSGAHMNPAITIGALVTRKIGVVRTIGYIIVQVLGAVVAYWVLDTFMKGSQPDIVDMFGGAQQQTLFQAADLVKVAKDKEWYVFFAEVLGATILTLGVATAIRAKKDKVTAAIAYSFSALVALIIAGSATAGFANGLTFLNPAIVFAAQGITTWAVWPMAVYIVAPIIGAIIGFALQDFLRLHSEKNQN